MLEGLSPDLSVGAYVNPEYDGRYIYLNGGVSGFVGDTTAILFDQVVLIEGTLGGPCPQEPYGTISVRGEEGEWYDVLFDGPDPNNEWQLDPTECDGIGHAFFRGESIGEVTVDFTGLYLWEESPW